MHGKSLNIADHLLSPQQVKANLARALIAALTSECAAYCILSGYEHLPDSFDTDIDFMVDQNDFKRMPRIIDRIARETSTRLFQAVDHEITGRAYWLAAQSGSELTIVQPDSSADYRHFGYLWLRSDEILAARRRHPRGFWIPSSAHEFAYYLLKRLNKRSFKNEHGERLHRLYIEDSTGCDEMMARFWSEPRRKMLTSMAAANEWAELTPALESLRREMKHHAAESLWQRVASSPERARGSWNRVTQPTGGWIAVMGPDGAGKSLVIDAIRRQFASAFRTVRCFHLRPKLLRSKVGADAVVTDPHGKPPRGMLASIAKVFFLLADYWLGYVIWLAPAMMHSDLLIFDRYIYDLLVDNKRVRYGGPQWLLRLTTRVVPKPDLVILLDAPAQVLWTRKQEVPFDEVVRQRAEYLRLAEGLSSTVVVNAAQPPHGVIRDVEDAIVAFYADRTARRFELHAHRDSKSHFEAEASSPPW